MSITEDFVVRNPLPFPLEKIVNVTLDEAILPKMEENKELVSEVEFLTGRQETYGSVLNKSLRIASFIQRNGLRPGDRVGIHCGNVLEYTQVALGIIRAGCAIVAIRGETVREIAHIVNDAKPVYTFTEAERYDMVQQVLKDADFSKGIITFSSVEGCLSLDQVLEDDGTRYVKPILDPKKSVALVTYSSGTTGTPKGVQLTHLNFTALFGLLEKIAAPGKIHRNVFLASWSPVHFSGASNRLGQLHEGGLLVLIPKMDLETAFRAIETYRVTGLSLFPTILSTYLNTSDDKKYDLSSLKMAFVTGGSVSLRSRKELQEKYNLQVVLYIFAQTESAFCLIPCDDPESIGIPAIGAEAKIIDPETGNNLKPNQIGEMCLRGPYTMMGYLNNETATRNALDSEGWLRTGDLAYYDEKGRFYYVERIKEIMKCKDSQVSPFELEEILLTHPAVAEAVVIGIPDKDFGEVPRAYVVLKDAYDGDLEAFVNEQVADHKKLRGGLCFLHSLPKSDTGKYLRKKLIEGYLTEKCL